MPIVDRWMNMIFWYWCLRTLRKYGLTSVIYRTYSKLFKIYILMVFVSSLCLHIFSIWLVSGVLVCSITSLSYWHAHQYYKMGYIIQLITVCTFWNSSDESRHFVLGGVNIARSYNVSITWSIMTPSQVILSKIVLGHGIKKS